MSFRPQQTVDPAKKIEDKIMKRSELKAS